MFWNEIASVANQIQRNNTDTRRRHETNRREGDGPFFNFLRASRCN